MEPVDPRDLRISDADRHRVAELLREAAGEGRLDLDELDQRLEQTYAAKTYGDLVPLTLDLPGHADTTPALRPGGVPARGHDGRPVHAPAGAAPTWNTSLAIMSESTRGGVWLVGERHVATAVMGSVVIDLREAVFPAGRGDVTIWAVAVMGSVQVLVDHTTAVVVDGLGIMGAFQEHRSRFPVEVDTAGPVVRVTGVALMGSVEVRRKETDAQKRRRRELGSAG
jgi:hypothetical protein